MRACLLLLLISTIACSTPTPGDIKNAIKEYNENRPSLELSQKEWQYTLENISDGKSDWIAIAPFLAPVIDRNQAIQLAESLYNSLVPNAKDTLAVLAILDQREQTYIYQQGTDTSCLPPLDDSGTALKNPLIYENTRLALLDAGPQGADCLWNLEALAEEIKAEAREKLNKRVR